jgi:hypothetical protein
MDGALARSLYSKRTAGNRDLLWIGFGTGRAHSRCDCLETPMLTIDDLGHSNSKQCLELVKQFIRIGDADVRERVLNLMTDLAEGTGELIDVDDVITFS